MKTTFEPTGGVLETLRADIDGKSTLVTVGTGSFGREFVHSVLNLLEPRRVIVFSRDEFKQFEMKNALSADFADRVRFLLAT